MEIFDFFQLIETGSPDAVQAALQANPTLLVSYDRLGRTPLHQAVARNSLAVINTLLTAGSAINALDRARETALFQAVGRDPHIFKLLLEAGADLHHRNMLGDTVLFSACDHGALEHTRLLLTHGAKVNTENDFSQTPLHAAALGRHAQIVELLLAAGAEVDRRDWLGNTALHLTMSGKLTPGDVPACLQIIDLLLTAGANGSAASKGGFTVLRFARMHPDLPELAAALTARGLRD